MEDYIAARPDVFFTGPDGSMRSNRAFSPGGRPLCLRHVHRLDAADRSGRQQLDRDAGPHRRIRRRAQHGRGCRGAAPCQPGLAEGRRAEAQPTSPACRAAASWWCRWSRPSASTCTRPSCETLDAWKLAESANMPIPPVMIYGDDVTHILTEEGIANLLLCAQCRRARTGDTRRCGIHGDRPGPGSAHRREPARPRRDPARRGYRHRQARRHARPARRALDQGPGARIGRAVPAAGAIQELVICRVHG